MHGMWSSLNRWSLWLMAALFLTACRQEEAMVPLDDFERLVTEIHLADGFFQTKSSGKVYWEDTIPYNVYLIEKYGYTEAQFDSTLNYLCHHPKRFERLYTRVLDGFIAMQKRIKAEPDPPKHFSTIDFGYMATPDSLHGSHFVDCTLSDTGLYRIEADIALFPQDQSYLPHMSFWIVRDDTVREYITPGPRYLLRANGRLTHYSFERSIVPPARLQGYFVGHIADGRPDSTWYSAYEIHNAAVVFRTDTLPANPSE